MSCDQGQFHPVDPDGYGADCRALTLCIYNSFGWGRAGEDSIGLYFETADLRTAVARGRDSYYGWFCSNLWHCGHVTHIIQGFTLPLITRRKWPNTGPPLWGKPFPRACHRTVRWQWESHSFNLAAAGFHHGSRRDWLIEFLWFIESTQLRHYRLQSFPFRLIGWRPIYSRASEDNLFEGWRGQVKL